jgi:hypothetical protein
MKRWEFTVTITEHDRTGVVEAETAAEARQKILAGEWDGEIGLSDPDRYTTRIHGKVRELLAGERGSGDDRLD